MTPERWERLKGIFEVALQEPPQEREAFLDRVCGDSELRTEARKLLAAHDHAGSFIEDSPMAGLAAAHVEPAPESRVGRRIGPYRLLAEIGRGGMGTVYRAVRDDDQYRKEVAIKLVQDQGSGFALDRFLNERQILAGLDHPHIARLLDGGTTSDGRPYLVMDLVEGEPIDAYCRRRALDVKARLELFREVCGAVQYAHQNLVVHRDIKPGNILVTLDGAPKLLDFGIAKLLRAGDDLRSPQATVTQFRALTLDYASPEQVRGQPITTASDVYSLGVLLYELLTGRRPHAAGSGTHEEVERAIVDEEPPRPSTVVRELRGDLDNILMMALRKEPSRRYVSVDQFAQDIRRHLEHLPVLARKDTAAYRVSKFIARHKAGVAVAALVMVTLLSALGVTLRQVRIARAERARAELRFNDVRALANSLIFEIHDSIGNLPGATPARKVLLERALHYLDTLAKEANRDSSLQRELASAYERIGQLQGHAMESNLGDSEGALASYEKAMAIWESVARANPDNTTDQLNVAIGRRMLALMFNSTGRPRVREELEGALVISGRLLERAPTDSRVLRERSVELEWLSGLQSDAGDNEAALQSLRSALQITESLSKANPQDPLLRRGIAVDRIKIANALATLGSRNDALDMNRSGLDIFESLARDESDAGSRRRLGVSLWFRGNILMMNRDFPSALESYRRSFAILETMEKADPQNALLQQDVSGSTAGMGWALEHLGKHQDGRDALDHAIASLEEIRKHNPSYVDVPYVLGQIQMWKGEALAKAGNARGALDSYRKGLANLEITLKGSPTPKNRCDVAAALARVGQALALMKSAQEASATYQRALEMTEPLASAKPPNILALYAVADVYFGLGELAKMAAKHSLATSGQQRQQWAEACEWYHKSANAWRQISNPGVLTPSGFVCGNPQEVSGASALCEATLRKLASTQP
jgi:tetratricopeptide (TPR) repeat protein